jgi:heme-degrading monooxygenase HmoA
MAASLYTLASEGERAAMGTPVVPERGSRPTGFPDQARTGTDSVSEGTQMIRVIYEWQVESGNIPAFRETWKQTTTMIHDSVEGARGSFLLQEEGNPGKILTIARWDSLEDWQAFWKSENPREMLQLRDLGERISVTVYDEFADYTV